MQSHQERVLEILQQHVPLSHDVFDLIATDYCLLLEHLDGIVLPCLFVATKVHLQGGGGRRGGGRRGGGRRGGGRRGGGRRGGGRRGGGRRGGGRRGGGRRGGKEGDKKGRVEREKGKEERKPHSMHACQHT